MNYEFFFLHKSDGKSKVIRVYCTSYYEAVCLLGEHFGKWVWQSTDVDSLLKSLNLERICVLNLFSKSIRRRPVA